MDFCQDPSNCIRGRLAASEPFGKFHPFVKNLFSHTGVTFIFKVQSKNIFAGLSRVYDTIIFFKETFRGGFAGL